MFLHLLLAIVTFSMSMFSSVADKTDLPPAWTQYELVAHGLGAIDSHTYTNTLEAFELNYKLGHRLFEVDLVLTSDNYLVTRNNWQPYLYKRFNQIAPPAGQKGKPLPLQEIKSMKVLDSYQILDFRDLLDLLRKYPDIYFITDTKDGDQKRVEQQFSAMLRAAGDDVQLLDRIIPQVYNQLMFQQVDEIYPFSSYVYTLSKSPDTPSQVLSFVRENPRIQAVTMPETIASARFLKQLKRAGVKTYINTINDTEKMEHYLQQGGYGFYTDSVTYTEFEAVRPKPRNKHLWFEGIKNVLLLPTIIPMLDWS
ncbi:phosphatidylinositol-specific phospholipase C/glycerophosphodiester phosphodiesterase family protein [Paenibacillus sp. GCM10027626]|uniref:phosphatidylinositol-specific phospholipase C/glycerophosphodiester phosphodiesterase family protein n=1 Tax=Paenibacillus sp. GCM10027626 TaxID=3273411 RepID=UPI0036423A7C